MIIHDIAEYVTWNIPPLEFYIQDLLTKEGTMLLYGAAGVKKSWLVEYLGFCIASGEEWLGFRTMQARVLVVNFEISSISYYWRLKNMSHIFATPPQSYYEGSPSVLYLEDRGTFERFAADVRPIHPEVIILDCLQGCYGGSENKTEEMSGFIWNMVELKSEHQAALVIVHHANKNPFVISSMDKARGSTKLTGWVDTVLYMAEQPSGTQLQFGKTRHSRNPLHPLNIKFEDYIWSRREG